MVVVIENFLQKIEKKGGWEFEKLAMFGFEFSFYFSYTLNFYYFSKGLRVGIFQSLKRVVGGNLKSLEG